MTEGATMSAALAELDDVAVRVADPELRAAELEVRDAARIERALHVGEALDLEGDVRVRRVDAVHHLRGLDQVQLAAAHVVPAAREAQVGTRREPETEQPL